VDIYEGAMEKWLKESWFKVGVLFVVILSGLFVVYYFVVFLPKIQNYEMQQKCDNPHKNFLKTRILVLFMEILHSMSAILTRS